MRRLALGAVVVAVAAGGGWWLWPEGAAAPDPTASGGQTGAPEGPATAAPARSVFELLGASLPEAAASADAGRARVHGVVLGLEGEPVPDAEVELFASSRDSAVLTARCEACGAPLLECSDLTVAAEVAQAVRAGKGMPSPVASTRTDAQGEFRADAPAGLALFARARDAKGRVGDSGPAEGDSLELEVTVAPPLRLDGTVRDEDDQPVADARLLLLGAFDAAAVEARSDRAGRFTAGCPSWPCTLWVYAEAPGFAPAVLTHLEVTADAPELAVTLRRGRALEVLTRMGSKSVDAELTASLDGHPRRLVAAGGRAVLSGLAADSVTLEARLQGATSGERTVGLFKAKTQVTLDLRASARALIEVLDSQGQPAVDATVTLGDDENQLSGAVPESGARVVLGPVGEGAYQLSVEVADAVAVRREIDLVPGDNPVRVVMPPARLITGKVVGPDGRPPCPLAVVAVFQGQSRQARCDAETGAFSLLVTEAGPWRLFATHPTRGTAQATVSGPAQGVTLTLDRKAGLRVTVTGEGRPAAGVMLQVRPLQVKPGRALARGPGEVHLMQRESQAGPHAAQTDEAGLAELWGLEAGSYQLAVFEPGWRSETRTVQLEEARAAEVTLALDRGASIDGTVVGPDGKPLEGVEVSAVLEGDDPMRADVSSTSDEAGAFSLGGLAPGRTWKLFATTDEAHAGPVATQAPARGVKLSLGRYPRVKGRVLERSGEPVTSFLVNALAVESASGAFEVPIEAGEQPQPLWISAEGFQSLEVEVAGRADVGAITLAPADQATGRVVGPSGAPLPGARVTCASCTSVVSGADGAFTLMLDGQEPPLTVVAARAGVSGLAVWKRGEPLEIRVGPPTRVDGTSSDIDGRPAPGGVVSATSLDSEKVEQLAVDGAGRFGGNLAQGLWELRAERTGFARELEVQGASVRADLGAVPGTCSLEVGLDDAQLQLALVRGAVSVTPDTPSRLEADHLGLDVQPEAGVARAVGLECAPHTVLWKREGEPLRGQSLELRAGAAVRFRVPSPAAAPGPP